MKKLPDKQKGVGAIAIVLVVVLLSLVGVYMSSMSTLSILNTASSGTTIQAWFAARSGVEWGIHQALNRPPCTCGTNCCSSGTAINGATLNFTGGGSDNFQAVLDCDETPLDEGGVSYCIYDIGVTATFGTPGDVTFARRRIEATVTERNAPP